MSSTAKNNQAYAEKLQAQNEEKAKQVELQQVKAEEVRLVKE